MSDSYPDIEIYLKRPDIEALRTWLDARVGVGSSAKRGNATILTVGEPAFDCVVVENAVKGGYASVWLQSDQTPWPTDRDCAVDAFNALGVETRCSAGPWEEPPADGEENVTGGWIRFTDSGESRVNWLAT